MSLIVGCRMMGGMVLSDTKRRNYRGDPIRDGDHAKRCPEQDCDYCVNAGAKRPWNRWFRRTGKRRLD